MPLNSFIDKLKPASSNFKIADSSDIEYISALSQIPQTDVQGALSNLATREINLEVDTVQTGFADLNNTISFDNASRTFSLQANTSTSYYIRGTKYTFADTKTIVISNTNGLHYIYIKPDMTLGEVTSFNVDTLQKENAYVAILYWDTTTNTQIYLARETHSISMPQATRQYLHTNFGMQYYSGLALTDIIADGNGTNNNQCQIGYDGGVCFDEDLQITIPPQTKPAQIPIYYRSGTNGLKMKVANNFPFIGKTDITATTRIKYNSVTAGVWELSEVSNNDFVLTHYFATNNIANPIVGFCGIAVYPTQIAARNAAYTEISQLSLLPMAEMTPIATVIYKTDSYTNSENAIIVSTDTGAPYIDFRKMSNYSGSGAITQIHNNLTNRDASLAHPSTAVSLDTTTFNKNLNNTITDVQLLAEAVDELNITGGVSQNVYFFANTVNNLSLATIRTNLSTASTLTNPIYTNNDTTITVNPSGDYYIYSIVPEGTATDRILYDNSGTFTNIQATFLGNILYNNINYGAYVSVLTAPLTTTAKAIRFVIYPSTVSYLETEQPSNNELIMGTGIRNRATGSNIVLNGDGTIPSNKVQSGVPSIQNIPVQSGTSSDHYYVETQAQWNSVKGKRIVLDQVNNNSQWYLNLPTLLTGRFVQVGEFVQLVVLTNRTQYPQSTAIVDAYDSSQRFNVGGSRLTPTVRQVYQFTYTGQTLNGQPFWAVTQFAYGASGVDGDVQTTVYQPQLTFRDYLDKSININGDLDINMGTKLVQDDIANTVTITKPTANRLALDFTNQFNAVETMYEHTGDIDFPSYNIDTFEQTVNILGAYAFLTDTVMNTSYVNGRVIEPISDPTYNITAITYISDTEATFRLNTGTTPVNMALGSELILYSNTGVNTFGTSRPITITNIVNGSGFTDLTCLTTTPVVTEGNTLSVVAYFSRVIYFKTVATSQSTGHWQMTFEYYIDYDLTNLATIQDSWYLTSTSPVTWFSGEYTNQVLTDGDLHVTGDIQSDMMVSGVQMKLGTKTITSSQNPVNGQSIVYNSNTDVLEYDSVILPNTHDYGSDIKIGTSDIHTTTLSALNSDYIVLDDLGGTLNATSGLNSTYSQWQGGGIDGNDNWFVSRQYTSGSQPLIEALATNSNNTFSSVIGNLASFDNVSCTNGNVRFSLYRVLSGTYYFTRLDTNGTSYTTSIGIHTNAIVSAVALSNNANTITLYTPSTRQYRVYNISWNGNFSTVSLVRTYTVPSGEDYKISQEGFVILTGELVYGVNTDGTLFSLDTATGAYTEIQDNFVNMTGGTSELRMGIRYINGEYNVIASGADGSVGTINLSTDVVNRYKATTANQPYAVGITSTGQPKLLALTSNGTIYNVNVTFNPNTRILTPLRMEGALPFLPDSNNSTGSVGMVLQKDSNNNLVWDYQGRIGVTVKTTSATLAQSELSVTYYGTGAGVLTLPAPTSLPVDGTQLVYNIQNSSSYNVTVNITGIIPFSNGQTSITILPNYNNYFIVRRSSISINQVIPLYVSPVYNMVGRRQNTAQAVVSAVDTTVLFDTEDSTYTVGNTGIVYNNGVFTNNNSFGVNVTVSYQVQYSTNSTGHRMAWIKQSNQNDKRLAYTTTNALQGEITMVTNSCTFYMTANDTFSVMTWHTAGVNINIGSGGQGGLTAGYANKIQIAVNK